MLVQTDGTPFDWFNIGKKYSLHGYIDDASGKITSDAMQIEPGIVASAIAIPTLILILMFVIWDLRRKRNYRG